jgi:hypothetical protein
MLSPISQCSLLIALSRIAATVHQVLTAQLFSGHTHLTNIGSMGRRTTDGIADCCVNCSIEVRAFRAEGVIAFHAQNLRTRPTNHARLQQHAGEAYRSIGRALPALPQVGLTDVLMPL